MKLKYFTAVISGILLAGCTTPGKRTAAGTGAGAGVGAGLGAIIGHQSGNTKRGAVIGAAAGAVLGGAIGNRFDKQAKELDRIAETERTESGLITKLKSELLFDVDSAIVRAPAKESLQQLAEIIKQYPEDRITVAGFTDDSGSEVHNQELSQRRAESVKGQLILFGVPAASLQAQGFGEADPVMPNTTAEGRAKNRRVELHITADSAKA